ncbi:IclR family transcriptional regulator [Lentzea xinjiangensis]|uniref:IclR family transcriptional regulator n=1 Tax=Lentzea xinjiangensis TaxID=402600 RepID=UPI0015A56BA5|nr:helix-turn-helix domain-containing protein [Lentzea xinjiangensis]
MCAAEKLIVVLETLAAEGGPLGVAELSRRSGLPKSTAHRLLQTLQKYLLVERWNGKYQLGVRGLELGESMRVPDPRRLRVLLQPWLQDLYHQTRAVVQLCVLRGAYVVSAEKLCGHDSVVLALRLADRARAARTVGGTVLLAYSARSCPELSLHQDLVRIRQHGVAVGWDAPDRSVCTVAAPVLDQKGHAVAAIAVSSPAGAGDPGLVISSLRSTARAASIAVRPVRPPRSVARGHPEAPDERSVRQPR